MDSLDTILDQALSELRHGSSLEEVLSKWPTHASELKALLETSLVFSAIPKATVPEPALRRKYLQKPATRLWLTSLHIFRLSAVSMAAVLLISGLAGTAYATIRSLPGTAFFPLKKTAEQIQLTFTRDPIARARMQVELSQKRLAETQTILDSPNKNPAQVIAALSELSQQTKETVSSVKSAASSGAMQQKNPPIVQSLSDLTQKQQALLNQLKGDSDAKVAANSALEANKEAKQFIAVIAAANDQASLAELDPGATTVSVSGTITQTAQNLLVVDTTNFTLDAHTEIKDTDENSLPLQDLTPQSTVNVVGLRTKNGLLAKEIVLVSQPDQGSQPQTANASGQSTTTLETKISASTTAASVKKSDAGRTTDDTKRIESDSSSTPPSASPTSTDTGIVGSFIYEDPSPQFAP